MDIEISNLLAGAIDRSPSSPVRSLTQPLSKSQCKPALPHVNLNPPVLQCQDEIGMAPEKTAASLVGRVDSVYKIFRQDRDPFATKF